MPKAPVSITKCRGFPFTVNNPDSNYKELLNDEFILKYKIKYACFSLEVGDSGTEHLQGYVYFLNTVTWKAATKTMNSIFPGLHIECAYGDPLSNIDYCSGKCEKKGNVVNDSFTEVGFRPMTKKEQGDAGREPPFFHVPSDMPCLEPITPPPSPWDFSSVIMDDLTLPPTSYNYQSSAVEMDDDVASEIQQRIFFCNIINQHDIKSNDRFVHPFCDACESYVCDNCVRYCFYHSWYADFINLQTK